jgi:hypothetical protein
MCIHLFNPPAPDCVPKSRCGNCHCAPRYWRLTIPAFAAYPGQPVLQLVPEWSTILRYGGGCDWGRLVPSGNDPDKDHPMNLSWHLTYQPFVDMVSHAFVTTPGLVTDWCVWVPGNTAGTPAAIAGDTVLYRKQPNAAAGDDTSNFTEQRHFRCLAKNDLHYWGSLNVDPGGEDPGPFLGWPALLTVVPWYGKK